VLLALLVAWLQVRGTQLVGPPAQLPRLANHAGLGYAILAATGLILAVRRRWPVPVLALVAAGNAGYYLAHYPDGPSWVALFVALYTVTAAGDDHRAWPTAAASIGSLSGVWLLTANLRPLIGAGWVFFRIGTAVMAAALGESVRAQRVITAQAIARAELAERSREDEAHARVSAERLRIAREVHDTVAHAIAVINVHAGMTAHVLDQRPAQARETLCTIEQTSAHALRELRATLAMLRDVDDERAATAPGLAQLAELTKIAADAGLDVHLRTGDPPTDLPEAVDRAAYRILQESITNAIRHAAPARLDIDLHRDGDLVIEVADDGPGSATGRPDQNPPADEARPRGDGDHAHPPGRGLTGMRERCLLLGGDLTAGRRPGGGFQVRARIPLATGPDQQPPIQAEAQP
jgi:signal transduction histidine kinase